MIPLFSMCTWFSMILSTFYLQNERIQHIYSQYQTKMMNWKQLLIESLSKAKPGLICGETQLRITQGLIWNCLYLSNAVSLSKISICEETINFQDMISWTSFSCNENIETWVTDTNYSNNKIKDNDIKKFTYNDFLPVTKILQIWSHFFK